MKKWLCPTGCGSAGLLVLRLTTGLVFALHGYGKLFGGNPGMEAFTGMVGRLGFPAPSLFAYLAALSEFLGGIALILGVWTQVACIFLAFVMLVAFFMVKKHALPMGDVDLALFGSVIALYCLGSGRYSVIKKHACSGNGCCGGAGKEEGGCCGKGDGHSHA